MQKTKISKYQGNMNNIQLQQQAEQQENYLEQASLSSSSSLVKQIETDFTLRKFEQALAASNEFLNHCIRKHLPTSASSSFSIYHVTIPNSFITTTSEQFNFKIIHPLSSVVAGCSTGTGSSSRNTISDQGFNYETFNQQERVAAVTLQCIYELWKERRIKKEIRHYPQSLQQQRLKIDDDELRKQILPLLQCYSNKKMIGDTHKRTLDDDEDFEGGGLISMDLLVIYVKFLHSLELHGVCVNIILNLIDHLFLSIDDHDHDDNDDHDQDDSDYTSRGNKIATHCYECLHLLLIELLPFVAKEVELDSILQDFTKVVGSECSSTRGSSYCNGNSTMKYNDHHQSQPSLLAKEPILSSVRKVSKTVQSVIHQQQYSNHNHQGDHNGNCHHNVLLPLMIQGVLEDCLEELNLMEQNLQKQIEQHSSSSMQQSPSPINKNNNKRSNLSSIVNSVSSRLANQITQNGYIDQHQGKDEDLSYYTTSTTNKHNNNDDNSQSFLKDHIINPLWTSEQRWANRSKVLVAGLTCSYIWRSRRHIVKGVKKGTLHIGGILMAPVNEIVGAIAPSSG